MSGYRFHGGIFLFFLVSILLSATGAQAAPTVSSFKINNEAVMTVNPTVTLPNVCSATSGTTLTGYMASESSDFTCATWQSYASVPMFTLSSGSGEKTVYFKVKDSVGEESAVVSDTIVLVGSGSPVVSWGANDRNQCVTPSSNSGFLSVAVGWKHNVGLKSDGTIVAWGMNDYSQISVPSPNNGFVAVGAGAYHSLGVKSDGSVVAWGSNDDKNGDYSGQCVVPAPNSGFIAVSAGLVHTLGLKADGSLVAWGTNRDWLGNDIGLCVVPSPNSGFVAIANGYYDNLALKSDGSIVTWGINVDWERKNINLGTVPSPNSGFVAIASGPYHHMGLKSEGSITAWGRTTEGQCAIPVPNSGFVALAGGGLYHSVALTTPLASPVVSSFSINNEAVMTVNPTVTLPNVCLATSGTTLTGYMASESSDFTSATWQSYAPVPMFTLSSGSGEKTVYFKVKDADGVESAVVSDTIQLESPGVVVAWGENDHGQVSIPEDNADFVEISSGWAHNIGLKSNGSIAVWGFDSYGICVIPSPNSGFVAVSAGAYHNLALKSDGSIVAWGRNDHGECDVPVPNSGFVAIVAGLHHSLGLKSNGSVVVWGLNDFGQGTAPSSNSGFVAIAAGVYHSLGLKSDGSVVGWGSNLDFQGNRVNQCQAPSPNSGFVSIVAGQFHSLGLKADGSVVAWGSNTDWLGNHTGQCEVPASTSPFVAIARGSYHSLAVKSDGSAAAWGWNEDYRHVHAGQCDVPSVNGRYVAVAGGGYHSLGLVLENSPQLTVVADPANGGTVSKSPDQVSYAVGTHVTLLATPAPGWLFVGWQEGGITVSTSSVYMYTVGQSDKTFTARFAAVPGNSYSLTLAADPANGGTVSKNPDLPAYVPGTTVTLQATPAAGWAFAGWWDGATTVSTNSVFAYSMPGVDKVLTARFRPDYGNSHTLTLVSDPVNGGTVSKSPDHPSYTPGDPVTLWAVPASGWAFAGWWDGTTTVSWSALYIHTVGNSDQTIIARFVKVPDSYRLTVIAGSADMGTVMKDPDLPVYVPGTQVTLTAQANAGYCFDRWTGDVSVKSKRTNPVTITMDSDQVVGVEFLPGSQPPAAVLAFSINNGAAMTANPTVTLPNVSVETTSSIVTHYMASESADFTSATWQPYASVPMFTLSSGSGVKTVYFKVKGSLNEESAVTSDTIQLGGTGYSMVGWGDNSWGNNEFGQNSIPAPNSGFLACAAGYAHSLGLKSDGSIVAWGSNAEGQCSVPAPNSGFVAVAAGAFHNLGLKSDGSIVAWGSNEYGQRVLPAPNTGFVAVAAGLYHSVGLKSDGSIVVWGNNGSYQCNGPEPNSGFVAIAAGDYHTVALKSDGSIVAWGDGRCSECLVPSPNTDFVNIGTGAYHSLGVKSDGSIVAFGLNTSGQCRVPVSGKDFVAASGGVFHSLGLKSDGTLVPWGSNLYHQGDIPASNIRFEAISAAVTRSLALVYEIGTLTVTLGTPEAVAAGAQWRLADEAPGVWHNSGETITPQVGAHTLTFKKVYDWAKPVDQQIEITTGEQVEATGLYTWSPWFVNTPPFITSLSITPMEPRTSDVITPALQVTDAEDDAIVAYRYEWVLDGVVRSTDTQLVSALTAKNQEWTLRAWAQDSVGTWSAMESISFTILNSPPTQPIVQVLPQPARPNQDLIVDVLVYSTDPDGDTIKYDFRWYKSVDCGRTWIHKVELDGSPQVSENYINKGELWDVFYTPYEVEATNILKSLPEEYTAASRPVDFAVARAGAFVAGKAMTAWDRSYVGENAPPEFRFDALKTQWTSEGLQLAVNWTAVDGDGEDMQVDLSWTDLEYSGLVAVGSDLSVELGQYSALVHPTPGKPFYLHAAVSDAKGAVTQVITGQINLTGLRVENQPASEVTEAGAVLNGSLSSTGGVETEVRVYWGRMDGGLDSLAWEHVETLGTRGEGVFSLPVSGLLPGTRYLYRCAARNASGEVWAGEAQAFETAVPVPTGVTAVGNTYQILVTWDAVTTATGYVVERQVMGTGEAEPMTWTVGAVTEFADDSAVPGVTYAYTVSVLDGLGNTSDPSEPVSASVTAEVIAPAAYKVTAKGYTMTRDLPTTGSLTFTTENGSKSGTIKIGSLKKVPANAQDDPERGIYYLQNCTQVPTLSIQGDVKTLAFDVPVYSLEANGEVRSVSARSVTFLKAGAFEKITITAAKPSDEGLYARTFIETEGSSPVPMLIKATGAVVEELVSTGKTAQPVKLLNVASKVYRNGAQTKVSLGAVGSLPRVVAEVAGVAAPQSEATPSSIRGSELKSVTVAGGPIVADEIAGGLEKMTAAGGNIRCVLIQSDTNLTLLQATEKKGVGGAIGTAGMPGAMAVKAQTQGKGKNKAAITRVYGQADVSACFYAGYNPETGQPTHSGGIGLLQTKAPGGVEGTVFLNLDLVKKMKVSPESPLLSINPDL